jgi:hypothetical protein
VRTEAAHFNSDGVRRVTPVAVMARYPHASDVKVCPSCRGRKVDRFGFDCVTCLGGGEVDE